MNRKYQHLVVAVTAALLGTACATNPDGSIKQDDRVVGAIIGAVAGCGIASATGGKCAQGAVVGAAAGFLIGWYFESKKVADAQTINKEYEQKKGYQVPKKDIQAAAFKTEVKPQAPAASGEREVVVTSNTDLVGYGDKVPVVEQKYAIYDEKNQLIESKTEKLTAVDGAGRYQTESKFKLPASAKDKKYRVETTLTSNGKDVKKNAYMVSFLEDGKMLLAGL
ncbi:MAG: hypothetical protein KGZ83_11980 [Sulfuricella sp.]|nr:hypothetical protein [Sulfuricella sp.]